MENENVVVSRSARERSIASHTDDVCFLTQDERNLSSWKKKKEQGKRRFALSSCRWKKARERTRKKKSKINFLLVVIRSPRGQENDAVTSS